MKKIFFQIVLSLLFLVGVRCANEYHVHMAVCSHLDAGWVSTYEDYYDGNNTRDSANVQNIFDSTITALESNNQWTYEISDISYFAKWWNDRGEDVHNRVKNLVQKGQIEFINGGWISNDEATVYYEDIIENFKLGNRFLQKKFGITPKIGWQIDSFGSSATHAALLAQAGYEALFFSRLDNLDREYRKGNQSLEFMWKPQSPKNESIFTHIFARDYGPVTYLNRTQRLDMVFNGQSLNTTDYDQINDYLQEEKKFFKTKHLLFPLCDDFYNPASDYKGMQDLVDHFKTSTNNSFEFKFSNITDFTHQVLSNIDMKTLPSKSGDFFPYTETDNITWSGFYTSKPMFKRLVRATSQYAQAMKVFAARTIFWRDNNDFEEVSSKLMDLQSVSSILQHHDGITGTMKDLVKHDYENMITNAVKNLQDSISSSFRDFLYYTFKEVVVSDFIDQQFINQFMKDEASLSLEDFKDPLIIAGNRTYTVVSFNPGTERNFTVKLKLPETNGKNISILYPNNTKIEPDIICMQLECWVYFMDTIPDFGFRLYKIVVNNEEDLVPIAPQGLRTKQLIKINNNSHIKIQEDFNLLEYRHCPTQEQYDNYVKDQTDCANRNFEIQYGYYKSAGESDAHPSGAYIFNPEKNTTLEILPTALFINAYVGKHVTILQFVRKDLHSFLLFGSLNTELPGFEVHTKIYGAPEAERGKEFILQLTDLEIPNSGRFFVDQNGYYMAERIYGRKDDFIPNNNQAVRQNYYPMTTMAYIKNDNKRFTLVTDRPQGVSSTSEGELEVMLHRTTLADDGKGLDEVLYEKVIDGTDRPINVTTKHTILFTDSSDSHSFARTLQAQQDRPIQFWVYKSESSDFSFNKRPMDTPREFQSNSSSVKFSILTSSLNSTYLTFQNINDTEAEIQICDLVSNKSSLFNKLCFECDITVLSVQETTWNTIQNKSEPINCTNPLKLLPMEIRTFDISLSFNYTPIGLDYKDIPLFLWKWFKSHLLGFIILVDLSFGIFLYNYTQKASRTMFQEVRYGSPTLLAIFIFLFAWPLVLLVYFIKGKRGEEASIQFREFQEIEELPVTEKEGTDERTEDNE